MAKKKKNKNKVTQPETTAYQSVDNTAEFDIKENQIISLKFFGISYVVIILIVLALFRLYFLLYWGN